MHELVRRVREGRRTREKIIFLIGIESFYRWDPLRAFGDSARALGIVGALWLWLPDFPGASHPKAPGSPAVRTEGFSPAYGVVL